MVDIHSHVLYGLDDGAQTLDQSLEMLRMAVASGTTDIVATPHANSQYTFQPDVIRARAAELTAAAVPGIRVHTGCDFHLQYENIQDALRNPARYTINQKNYLLVEFSNLQISHTTSDILFQLRSAGMAPIITHPERNWLLQKRLGQLEQWVSDGCYLQVTAQSLLGRFGRHAREYADTLVRRGLVQFVASDAHDVRDRTPSLREAYAYVAERYGPHRAEELFVTNPRAALHGEAITAAGVPQPAGARRWYRFWS